MEILTKYGNSLDIQDSLYLTSIGDCEGTNVALSFYNHLTDFAISYFVEENKIIFQNDNSTDYDYWTDEKVKVMENNLKKIVFYDVYPDEELKFYFNDAVEYILFEMDLYSRYLKMKFQ